MEYENTEERAAESGLKNNPAGGGQNGGAADWKQKIRFDRSFYEKIAL